MVYISGIMLAVLHILIVNKCMRVFLGPQIEDKKRYVYWIGYISFIGIGNIWNGFPNELLLAGNIFFIMLIAITTRQSPLKTKIFSCLMICSMWMLIEVIAVMFMRLVDIKGEVAERMVSFVSKIVVVLLVISIDKIKHENIAVDVSLKDFFLLICVPVVSIYFINNIFNIAAKYPEYDNFAGITSAIFLLLNYGIFDLYSCLSFDAQLKAQNKLFVQQVELCGRHTSEHEEMYKELRRMRHDMKNHMTSLLGLIDAGKNEAAHEYIAHLLEQGIVFKNNEISRTGNVIVDSLINYKCMVALKDGIDFNANVFIPSNLPFKNENIVIILGNLIENAIEASNKVEIKKRYINLEVTFEKNMLQICIKNSCVNEKRRIVDGLIATTKDDKANHGVGLLSVKQAAEAYDGDIVLKDLKNDFVVVVVMYEKE